MRLLYFSTPFSEKNQAQNQLPSHPKSFTQCRQSTGSSYTNGNIVNREKNGNIFKCTVHTLLACRKKGNPTIGVASMMIYLPLFVAFVTITSDAYVSVLLFNLINEGFFIINCIGRSDFLLLYMSNWEYKKKIAIFLFHRSPLISILRPETIQHLSSHLTIRIAHALECGIQCRHCDSL